MRYAVSSAETIGEGNSEFDRRSYHRACLKGRTPVDTLVVFLDWYNAVLPFFFFEATSFDCRPFAPHLFFSLSSGSFPLPCSMVINCVPTAKLRGEMLVGYREHLKPGGHLFLMLPLLCLTKSSNTTRKSFAETLRKAGFRIRETRDSPKVAFFCATTAPIEAEALREDTQPLPTEGTRRSNDKSGGRSAGIGEAGVVAKTVAKRKNRGGNDFAVAL